LLKLLGKKAEGFNAVGSFPFSISNLTVATSGFFFQKLGSSKEFTFCADDSTTNKSEVIRLIFFIMLIFIYINSKQGKDINKFQVKK
jgi:hypothetical protein